MGDAGQWGPDLLPDELMGAGEVFEVSLWGYDLEGVRAAWAELGRHTREVELGVRGFLDAVLDLIPNGLGLIDHATPTTSPPARQGADSAGRPIYGAKWVCRTWREAGNEYDWRALQGRLVAAYRGRAPSGGALGTRARERLLEGADALAIRTRDAADDVARGISGVVGGVTDAVGGAGDAVQGAGGVVAQTGAGIRDVGQASRAAPPVVTLALVFAGVLGVLYIARGGRR